jgi:hypothetical protein
VGLFRKKPVLVEAIRFDGCEYVDDIPTPMFEGSFDLVPEWLVDALAKSEGDPGAVYADRLADDFVLAIVTLEGTVYASAGDFIIKGTAGEIYPCKPTIFLEIYEAVDETARVAKGQLTADAKAQLERLEAVHDLYWRQGFAFDGTRDELRAIGDAIRPNPRLRRRAQAARRGQTVAPKQEQAA